jgi:hypothetical protein
MNVDRSSILRPFIYSTLRPQAGEDPRLRQLNSQSPGKALSRPHVYNITHHSLREEDDPIVNKQKTIQPVQPDDDPS